MNALLRLAMFRTFWPLMIVQAVFGMIFSAVRFVIRLVWRFASGAHMDGKVRTDATWTLPGTQPVVKFTRPSRWCYMPRLYRAGYRTGALAVALGLAVAYSYRPELTVRGVQLAAAALAVAGLVKGRRWWKMRRFHNLYTTPLRNTLRTMLGVLPYEDNGKWLRIDPDLQGLAGRLNAEMSPAEKKARQWYGENLEPVVRWVPDQAMRGYWTVHTLAAPLVTAVRRPVDKDDTPRVEIFARNLYVTPEMMKNVQTAVQAKLGLSDLDANWDQVGNVAKGTFKVPKRPPSSVTLADIAAEIDRLPESEFVLGLGSGGEPIIVSLDDDSPHIACSAGSGAGKSVLAMLIAVQILRRGGEVVILDLKSSHKWAKNLPGVTYCRKPEAMHVALLKLAKLAAEREDAADEVELGEDFDPGPRHLLIFEEMNSAITVLRRYWEKVREKDDPKASPAIDAFASLMNMGRSAKVNIFGVAQMLTARTTGGPESRESFGVRCLSRYSANNWKMLAPEFPMPRKSRIRGRWQVVTADGPMETQVAFLQTAEAIRLAYHLPMAEVLADGPLDARRAVPVSPAPSRPVPDQGGPVVPAQAVPNQGGPAEAAEEAAEPAALVPVDELPLDPFAEPVTIQEAIEQGVLNGSYDKWKKRLQRDENAPAPVGTRGRANLYKVADLVEWTEHVDH